MIADTVAYLKAKGRQVFYDAEHAFDGYKDEPEYALATWVAAAEAGADAVVLCDQWLTAFGGAKNHSAGPGQSAHSDWDSAFTTLA